MTGQSPGDRLNRPGLSVLVDELARRFSNGDSPTSVTLRDMTAQSRAAVADLLGADRLPGADARVRVDRLLSRLGVGSVRELKDLIEQLRGPLPNRRDERAARLSARASLWSWLNDEAQQIQLGEHPSALIVWAADQRAAGVRGSAEQHRGRLRSALEVLRALPADAISLASLASDQVGDPHALDYGGALAGLVLDALARVSGSSRPRDAERARLMWEMFGVAPDPLSSTVLVLGRTCDDRQRTPLDSYLFAAATAHEPVVLTLATLRRWPLHPLPPESSFFVVENPSLIAEAAADSWDGPRLVCSSGRPSVATVTLLRQLAAAGAKAYQHADFDAAGIGITGWLADRAGTVPWRMNATDYQSALSEQRQPSNFSGTVPATPWDPDLQRVLVDEGRAVYEEQLRRELLAAMRDSSC